MLGSLHVAMMVLAPVLSAGTPVNHFGVTFLAGMPAAAIGVGALGAIAARSEGEARRTVLHAAAIRAVAWAAAWNVGLLWVAAAGEVAMVLSQLVAYIPLVARLRVPFLGRYSLAVLVGDSVAVGTMTVLVGGSFVGNWLAQVGVGLLLAPLWGAIVRYGA